MPANARTERQVQRSLTSRTSRGRRGQRRSGGGERSASPFGDVAVEVCEICGDYSHSAHNCPYYPQYENYHYSSYASPQPDFFGFMSNPQIPQHEGNQQSHQSTSLEDMMKQLIDSQQQFRQLFEEIRQIDFEIPGLKDLETQFIQYNVRLQNMTYEEELCSAQPIFNPDEDVSVDTLKNFEVNEVTKVEDYWRETAEGREVFQIEPEIVIALNEGENEMKIDIISDKLEKPQIESEEDQPLIFYTADTFMLDDPDATDSFALEVPNELLNLKEGVHASLPKYVDASFVVDISKGEGTT
ncbi:hypothetical protein Scep_028212 [Stephania cephalantha]|uniref:Uncharacterized protein n=1 Tax=Stephania cephalantha TaxID=152367 RepID=A0AAP0HN91_9MAGN